MRNKTGILIARRFLRAMTATVLAIIIAACTVSAKLTLHEIFTDNAVLQHGRPVIIWGNAEPSEQVTVKIAVKMVRINAGNDGRWRAVLPAMKAGGPFTLSVTNTAGDGAQILF